MFETWLDEQGVDLFAHYLNGLEIYALVVAAILLVLGIDDFFIDLAYWSRRFYRALFIYYLRFARAKSDALYKTPEKPLAIVVPAWQEADVIAEMAELAVQTLDYENYHIFIGTYPNDPATQAKVDRACALHPNVHKVVCALPGPTSKADCLNTVINSILAFEQKAKMEFAGFVLHDSEDVISPLELRLFNKLVDRKDMIQLPVHPLPGKWYEFTRSHYVDEFAENHAKDVVVREALIGQIPSAGVGTCFSRRAILRLMVEGDGQVFDVRSLTEDYDIGFRLSRYGMSGVFVHHEDLPGAKVGTLRKPTISVRAYFPSIFSHAVRQKARWIVGIVFQGSKYLKWTRNLLVNYFLWRDRRGALVNVVSMLALLLLLQLLVVAAVFLILQDAYRFPAVFRPGSLLERLLLINGAFFLLRVVSRAYFVSVHYGLLEGLLSFPRTIWGMIINFFAVMRAIKLVVQVGSAHRVAWDKTQHQFPEVIDTRARFPVGVRLIEKGYLTQETLDAALASRKGNVRLGYHLLREGFVTPEQLAEVLAEQTGGEWRPLDPYALPESLLKKVPASVALKYSILPIAEEGEVLVIARESSLPPVALAAIGRRLQRRVRYVLAPPGTVTVGLRHWYARWGRGEDPLRLLDEACAAGRLNAGAAKQIWRRYVSGQSMLGDYLVQLNLIEPAVMSQALIAYEDSELPFGEFLVSRGIISEDSLRTGLESQAATQPRMEALIREAETQGTSSPGSFEMAGVAPV